MKKGEPFTLSGQEVAMATMQATKTELPPIEKQPFLEHPGVDAERYLAEQDEQIELLGMRIAAFLDGFPEIASAIEGMSDEQRLAIINGLAVYEYNDYNRGLQVGMAMQRQITMQQGLERARKLQMGREAVKSGRSKKGSQNGARATLESKARKAIEKVASLTDAQVEAVLHEMLDEG
jgi:hypothetical protein